MPYIGHAPTNSGNFYILDDFNGLGQDGGSSTYDQNANGTIVNFKLMVAGVAITPNVDNLIVTIDGVLQHPTDAYTISGSILTFTGAPASGVDFHVVIMGQSSTVGEGSIGADELQVSGDGTNNQLLKSDGDGTMSWINQNTVTASTAATLATARAINGVNFDGSAAITVTADANTLSNTTLKSTVVSSSLTSVGTLSGLTIAGTGTNAAPTLAIDNSSSSSYIHSIEALGANMSAGQINIINLGKIGSTKNSAAIGYKWNSDGADTNLLTFEHWGTGPLMTLDGAGKIGIGTSSPTGGMLDIKQSASYEGVRCIAHDDNNYTGTFGIGDAGYTTIRSNGDRGMDLRSNSQMRFYIDDANTLGMLMNATGKVGIGYNNPDARLVVGSGTSGQNERINIYAGTNAWSSIYFTDAGNGATQYQGVVQYNHSDNHMDFYTNQAERMRITSGGQLLLGSTNTNPWEDTSGNGSFIYHQGTGNRNTGIAMSTDASVGYSMFYLNMIDGANAERYFAFYRNDTQIGTVSLNGTGNVTYNTSSDYRLKENVGLMTGSIARLKQIKPSTFNFISEPDRSCEGFIAHELAEIVPNAVSGEKDAMRDDGVKIDPQGVDFGRVVPLLVSALQEAIERIEVLENA